ncbi:hypothetical protein TorRG33x02_066290, partial [Trema orientale]
METSWAARKAAERLETLQAKPNGPSPRNQSPSDRFEGMFRLKEWKARSNE